MGGKHLNKFLFCFLYVEKQKQTFQPIILITRTVFLRTIRALDKLPFPWKNIIFFEIFIWPFYAQSFIETVRGPPIE